MDREQAERFWSSLLELIPKEEIEIKKNVSIFKEYQISSKELMLALLFFFSFIEKKEHKPWASNVWKFLQEEFK